jgi:hypothetical protein
VFGRPPVELAAACGTGAEAVFELAGVDGDEKREAGTGEMTAVDITTSVEVAPEESVAVSAAPGVLVLVIVMSTTVVVVNVSEPGSTESVVGTASIVVLLVTICLFTCRGK